MMDLQKHKLDDDTLNQIRQEIGAVITKYVDIEPENVEVKVMLKDYKSHPACDDTTKRETYAKTI